MGRQPHLADAVDGGEQAAVVGDPVAGGPGDGAGGLVGGERAGEGEREDRDTDCVAVQMSETGGSQAGNGVTKCRGDRAFERAALVRTM